MISRGPHPDRECGVMARAGRVRVAVVSTALDLARRRLVLGLLVPDQVRPMQQLGLVPPPQGHRR